MPVIDGVFVPRTPLTPAELHVDWAAHNTHIVERRLEVERRALPAARRVALLSSQGHGLTTARPVDELVAVLNRQLDRTVRFGYSSVVRELELLRQENHAAVTAGLVVPDAGRFAYLAARGLTGVTTLMGRRALEAATAIVTAITQAVQTAATAGSDTLLAATTTVNRQLHNHVLELVGESLNLGRAAGAMSNAVIPEYALRSEQLDRNTCEPCDELHGTIVQVGSPEFFAVLPPIGCLGGGRCRGVMVFGDGPRDVRAPERLAA